MSVRVLILVIGDPVVRAVVGVFGDEGLGGRVFDGAETTEGVVFVLVVLAVIGEVAVGVVYEREIIRTVVIRVAPGEFIDDVASTIVVVFPCISEGARDV